MTPMESAFALVAFLARSENRVTVLDALQDDPSTRPALQEATGIPRATLSRILADFRDHGLAERDGHRYALTPLGGHLAGELAAMFSSIDSMRALQAVAEWLPLDTLDVDVTELDNVEVTLPTPIDPMAPVKAAAAVIDDVEFVRGFCYSVLHAPILAECRNVIERGHRFEGVIAAGVLDVIAGDPELAERMSGLLTQGAADVYVLEGSIEPQLIIADDITMFLVADEEGAIQGLVCIGDEAVLPWAEETFESIKREASPLTRERAEDLLTA